MVSETDSAREFHDRLRDRLRGRDRGSGGDRDSGAVILVVAMTMTAIVILSSLVINIGGARYARARDQDSADAMALAAAAKLDASGTSNQAACSAAWAYATTNLGVASSPAPPCVNFAAVCDPSTARTVSVTTGSFTFSFVNPVPDNHALFASQPATTGDSTPCKRFGVQLTHQWNFPFDRGTQILKVEAIARLASAPGSAVAPVIVLDPHACETLTVGSYATMNVTTSAGSPAYIAIDSDGASCPSDKKVIVDTTGSGQITAGLIAMWALSTANAARAYDPASVGTTSGFYPAPVPLSQPVTRSPVDFRYNCLPTNGCPTGKPSAIADLVARYGSGVPSGFTRWTSLYSCAPAGDLTVPRGNWYIDCPTGLSTSGILTFRGGDIVADAPFTLSGNARLRTNCDVLGTADCPTLYPSSATVLYLRNGDLSKSGTTGLWLPGTFVYLANGTLNMTGDSELVWTRPNDPASPFYKLMLWTETTTPLMLTGNANLNMAGILFAPNATMTLAGSAGTTAIQAQFFINKLTLSGSANLTVSASLDQVLPLGGAGSALIR